MQCISWWYCYGIKKAAKEVLERGCNFYLNKERPEGGENTVIRKC